MAQRHDQHPSGYELAYQIKAVLILGLGFGLVGLDRWVLPPLFPAIAADLNLGYADLGNAVGILALAWGAPRRCSVMWRTGSATAGSRCRRCCGSR